MTLFKWSRTAASNGTADSTALFPEGQAPSSLNDGTRGMMAATAKYRDDIAGAIVTAGTSTAYTVTSYQGFDTLPHLDGQMIAFTPHATNGATVTLNVDSLNAKPLRTAPNAELLPGVLIQGTPYIATYNNADGAFYLRGFYGNPYNIPLAGGLDYWGATAPNSSFVFPVGQAISRTTYATLFALVATTYGAGDGSTTFNVPDLRGRIGVPADNMGGAQAFRANNILTNPLGSTGGNQQTTLSTPNLPPYTPAGSIANGAINSNLFGVGSPTIGTAAGVNQVPQSSGGQTITQAGSTFTGTAQGGTSTAYSNMQPSIVCNYIMRII